MSEDPSYTPMPSTGAQFGKYRVVRKLGEGAFGSVFEALLPGPMGFAKKVAIKKLRSKLVDDDPKFVQSMVNEARIGGLLHHANIVDIIEFGQVGRHYYLAMEFVDGATLEEMVKICRRRQVLLPRFAIVDLALQACRGLHYAHQLKDHEGMPLNLVHRDLKPSNIIVDREGTAKILDFGIAKAASNLFKTTTTGLVKGTPRYMSPEQISGEEVLTSRSDIFSLGAVLYEVITGRVLFHAQTLPSLMLKIVEARVEREIEQAEVAFPGCGALLDRALRKEPEERFPDSRSLGDALRELGRKYPAEADMAEVIGRLLPEVERTDVREIADSVDLRIDVSETGFDQLSTDISESGKTPIPPPAPSSAGWQQFTAAFGSLDDPPGMSDAETVPFTPPPPPATTMRAAKLASPSGEPRDPPPPPGGSVSGWKFGIVVVGLLATIVLLVLVTIGLWRLPLDTGPRPGDAAVAETVEDGAAPEKEPDAEPTPEEVGGEAPETPAPGPDIEPAAEVPPSPAETPPEESPSPSREVEATPPPPPPPVEVAATAPEPVPDGEEEAPVPLRPGSVSLYVKPWVTIYVDGRQVGTGTNTLRNHPLEGGPHEVQVMCPQLDGRTKSFSFVIDGQHEKLGCWDLNIMDRCP